MFDVDLATPGADGPAIGSPARPPQVPLERLEAQICELAGHLAAATCRFLVLLGPATSISAAQMLSCTAALSWMTHGDGGAVLALGRRRRRPSSAIRRAARERDGGPFAFYRPDGTRLPSGPPLPEPGGAISQAHDADITPDTIIPSWYGERLDLDHAIYVCFANARTREEREQDRDPADRDRVTVYEPEDCDELIRQYLEQAPRRTAPVLVPIQV